MTTILDTNVVLYFLADRLTDELPEGSICVSVITELELYSYPNLSSDEEERITEFLSQVNVIDLLPEIKSQAVLHRRSSRLKLPDAIIIATASALKGTLWTCDTELANRNLVPVFIPSFKQVP